ncbi:c-type cytochrome [Azospirillum rugosum]|uniref:Cytochrome c n=1 Tax=Azospirillum rugosum TaxID=416170 RepID=A0ABS4SKC2_9PROT|nr:c-type cytochrome [Azospirillum rugosum]MBP2293008.1 cytochrome c [Azospirillum rugosum]MDQ0526557.1 cytochrome c [Azospirillum rugosum]
MTITKSTAAKSAILALVAGTLLASGTALAQGGGPTPKTAEEAAGKQVFHQCAACHSLDSSKNAFGPSLYNVVGRKAGSIPRFDYSDALKASNITWTEDSLRQWIAGNDKFVPGTRMRHVAITDRAEQDYLIAFLKSLKQ